MTVLSVAGSGKTMVLIERMIRLIEDGMDPAGLLAITFAKRAVLEIQGRLKKRLSGHARKAMVCTFHSLGFRILRKESRDTQGFRIVQGAEQEYLCHQAMEMADIEDEPADLLRKVSLAKNDLISYHDLEQSEKEQDRELAKVYTFYELMKMRERLLDFDDLLYLSYQILKSNGDILRRYQQRFHYILVDEFQDSSRVMVELVRLLSQHHGNIWVAGDDDQSIHGFRGARSDIFVSFNEDSGKEGKTITMARNYRSSKNIITAANNLISRNKKRVEKQMVTDNEDGADVVVFQGADEKDEAEAVSQSVLDLAAKGYRFDEIAILVRLYRLMPLIEAALVRKNIPYNLFSHFLYTRDEIRTALNVMESLLEDRPNKDLDLKLVSEIRKTLYPNQDTLTLKAAFDIASFYALDRRGTVLVDEDAQSLKGAYLDAFWNNVSQYDEWKDLLDHMNQANRNDKSVYQERLTLVTIHQAKGLEFKCVIVPGLNEGNLPRVNSVEDLIHLEEERRLMYVAMTRAMERLILSYRKRQTGEDISLPSRFLGEMACPPEA